jgi:hypothetical protein
MLTDEIGISTAEWLKLYLKKIKEAEEYAKQKSKVQKAGKKKKECCYKKIQKK